MPGHREQSDAELGTERLTCPRSGERTMASSDVSAAVTPPPAPSRPVRRRWPRVILAFGLLVAGGVLALEGWAAYAERSARQALAGAQLDGGPRPTHPAPAGRPPRGHT